MECKFCQKTFSKGEHLRRHERSHTGARPYKCKYCQRLFSRQDSQARHEKLHTRKQSEDYPSPPSSMISQPKSETTASHSHIGIPEIPQPVFSTPTQPQDQVSVQEDHFTASSANDTAPTTVDLDFDLIWPDSEDLFETLLASESRNQWQMPLPTLPISVHTPTPSIFSIGTPKAYHEKSPSTASIPSGESSQAVHNVSEMVTSLSSSVTAAVEATSLTSVFLDECLHMFFARFIPTFPILHRSTFVFKDCTQPLLLNAMAIGSLYLGPKDSTDKGEALWRLAHVAVTTSWELLITHKGPYDPCQGVQLVVTALLAQVYGALSKNHVIRTTSQAFHALGFFWARQCVLSDSKPYSMSNLPTTDSAEAEKNRAWKVWAAKEIQQRALLGHYVVDGLISKMSGENPSVRHAANQLNLPSTQAAFDARTADEWLSEMRSEETGQYSFRKIISSLFSSTQTNLIGPSFSAFSLRVILEGVQSLASDCDSEEALIGVPTKSELRKALAHIHGSITSNHHIPEVERLELLLRWHAICLDTCKDSAVLCRSVCSRYRITQNVCGGNLNGVPPMDLISWANTEDGRRALLHAIAIQDIVEQLPRGRAHVIHIPSALFASATLYCVFSLVAGQTTVHIPSKVDWQSVLLSGYNDCPSLGELCETGAKMETKRYIRGEMGGAALFGTQSLTCSSKNLLYEMNSMQKLFRCLCSQWGVAYDMADVVDQWMALSH